MNTLLYRYITSALRTLCVIGCIAICACGKNDTKSIVILYENDVHCNINNYARMKGFADAIADTAWVGLTSSGDFMHGGTVGAISEGRYILDIMKEMNYDAIALGNHEFDFGFEHLYNMAEEYELPIVNLNLRSICSEQNKFSPYIIKEYGNKQIAFIGVLTPETLISEAYSFYDKQGNQILSLCEDNLIECVQNTIDQIRMKQVDYVVLLSHLGESSAKKFITSKELISETYGIDVVLDGHTHSTIECDTILNVLGKPVILSQTGSLFRNVGKLLIDKDGNIYTKLIPVDSINYEDQHVREVIDSIQQNMSELTERIVCHSKFPLSIYDDNGRQKVRYAETEVGNLVADAIRHYTMAQIAIHNGGGIRSSLPAGDWSYGQILNMLPYNNRLQVVKIKGEKLVELLAATTSHYPMEDGQFPQVSGLSFTLNTDATGLARISNVKVLNESMHRYEPINLYQHYFLGTTDYCTTGGGMYGILHNAEITDNIDMLYSDAFIHYIENAFNQTVPEYYSKTWNRIEVKH